MQTQTENVCLAAQNAENIGMALRNIQEVMYNEILPSEVFRMWAGNQHSQKRKSIVSKEHMHPSKILQNDGTLKPQ